MESVTAVVVWLIQPRQCLPHDTSFSIGYRAMDDVEQLLGDQGNSCTGKRKDVFSNGYRCRIGLLRALLDRAVMYRTKLCLYSGMLMWSAGRPVGAPGNNENYFTS